MRWTLALLSLLWISAAQAQNTPLGGRLADIVRGAELGDGVGILVAEGDNDIYALRADTPRNPASNMKLVTAAAALLELGPNYRMDTGLYGRVEEGRVADLVLRGTGDPSLSMADLVQLAAALADRGVRAVDRVWVDGSYFDDEILPPAFDQQPNEMAAFRAAVGAVAVDRSSFVLRVVPGAVGAEPSVRLLGAGYFDVDNGMTTSEGGAPNVIASQRALEGGRLALVLRGTIPAGISGVGYRRRVENPLTHAAFVMAEALQRAGIRGGRRVRVGTGPSGLPLLASRQSAPLSQLLYRVGKNSDNFVAEMVLKVIGANAQRPGSSARGARVLTRVLERAGVAEDAATIVNGSGLFEGNRIAPRHLEKLLKYVYQQPSIRHEYLAHLAVGGVDGTLRRRMREVPAGAVRMKTGTLNDVIALSGYILGPSRVVRFSFLANGIRGRQGAARRLADSLVEAIVADLY